jgi:Outer membrane protein beta-barrel domain
MTGLLLLPQFTTAQTPSTSATVSTKIGLGFRVGLNFAKVSGDADSIKYSYKPGFMFAVFLSPHTKGIIGYRTELLYSKQGFEYTDEKGNTGNVSNDYIMMPHMMTINITKFVQLQAGAFAGYLLHSKNSNGNSDNESGSNNYLDLMNRFDYGAAGGIEIHPFKGLVLNGRYNMGFAKLYKEQTDNNITALTNPFMPFGNIDTKNAVIQLSLGYQF